MNSIKFNFFVFVFALVFCLAFYDCIQITIGFSYTDELFCILMGYYWLYKRKFVIGQEFILCICVFLLFLAISIYISNNVFPAILTDFFIQIKPFLIYYICKDTKFYVSNKDKQRIKKICLVLAIMMLPIGFLYFMNENPIMAEIFGHPSRFGSFMSLIGITYLWTSKKTKRDIIISCLIVLASVLSLRSKTFGFSVIFVGLMYLSKRKTDFTTSSTKSIVAIALLISVSLYVSWEKIQFYFVTGTQNDAMFARPALYLGALDVIKDYPVFGSGFGTYASYASDKYYSPLYYHYGLYEVDGLCEGGNFISDTFFPQLAQFGIVGIMLFMLFWKKRIKELLGQIKNKSRINCILGLLTIIYLLIESVADSTFNQNRGMFAMMLLAMIQVNQNEMRRVV